MASNVEGPCAPKNVEDEGYLSRCGNCSRELISECDKITVIRGKNPTTAIRNDDSVASSIFRGGGYHEGKQCMEDVDTHPPPGVELNYDDCSITILEAMSIIYGFPLDKDDTQDILLWKREDECTLCENCAKVMATFYQSFEELKILADQASYISKGLDQLHACMQKIFTEEETGSQTQINEGGNVGTCGESENFNRNISIVSTSSLRNDDAAVMSNEEFTGVTGEYVSTETNEISENIHSSHDSNENHPFDLELVKVEAVDPEGCQNSTRPPQGNNCKNKPEELQNPCILDEAMTGSMHILSENGKIIRASTRTRKVKTDLVENVATTKPDMKSKRGRVIKQKTLQNADPKSLPSDISTKVRSESSKSMKIKASKLTQISNKYSKGNSILQKPEKESGKQYKCEYCDKEFSLKNMFEKHLVSHEKLSALCRCTVCEKTFPTALSLLRHISSVHDANKEEQKINSFHCAKCPASEMSYASYEELKSHYETTHKAKLNFCIKCGKCFNTSYGLNRHFKKVHKTELASEAGESSQHEKAVKLENDHAATANVDNLLQGLNNTPEIDADKSESNQQNSKSTNANNSASSSSPFKCHLCSKGFKKKFQLNRHILFHDEAEPRFGCSQCPKRFFKSSSLERHMIVHTSENPIVCNQCGKVFVRRDHLKRHVDSIHNKNLQKKTKKGLDGEGESDPALTCSECKKTFSRHEYLRLHMRLHTGERPYVCEKCGKDFRDPRNLAQHLVTHKTDRPFCCSVCGLTFKRAHHLNDHEGTHREDVARPFVCTVPNCGKAFKLRKHLATHELVHSGAKDHTCHVCGRAFSRKDNLLQHIKKLHGKKFADELLVVVEEQRERHRQANVQKMAGMENVLEQALKVSNGSSTSDGETSQEILQIIPTQVVTTIPVPVVSIVPTFPSTSNLSNFSFS